MRNIDMYTYREKPFNVYRKKEIYPLNDPGLKKYISYDSHNANYLKLINPKVFKYILKMNDEDIPDGMKKAALDSNEPSKFDLDVIKREKETKKEEQPIKEDAKEDKDQHLASSQRDNVCMTEKNEPKKEKQLENKRLFLKKFKRKRLPPLNVHRTCEITSPSQGKDKNSLKFSSDFKDITGISKRSSLPEVMMTNPSRFKTTISNIHILNSKEFGEKYNPFSTVLKTGDTVGINFYGARFNH